MWGGRLPASAEQLRVTAANSNWPQLRSSLRSAVPYLRLHFDSPRSNENAPAPRNNNAADIAITSR